MIAQTITNQHGISIPNYIERDYHAGYVDGLAGKPMKPGNINPYYLKGYKAGVEASDYTSDEFIPAF